jgi:hypothetical protein
MKKTIAMLWLIEHVIAVLGGNAGSGRRSAYFLLVLVPNIVLSCGNA